jgi:hypothetical protein
MRFCVIGLAAALAAGPGCTGKMAPGQPLDNITAHNTENTGDWQVTGRTEQDGRILIRIAADQPERAEVIARKAIDQWLSMSPAEIVVDVYPASNPSAAPVAHVVWQRPTNIRVARDIPDNRGTVSSDREGSPERAVGAHERD